MLSLVLNGVLSLGDIRDVEKLCDRIASQALGVSRVRGRTLGAEYAGSFTMQADSISQHDRNELLAYLIAETWVLWLRYDDSDDGRGRKTFSGYAVPQLRCRVLDWWRKKLGRGKGPGEWGAVSTDSLDDGEFERSLGARDGDDPFDRVSTRLGLLAAGGGKARRLVDARGGAAPRRVA